MAASVLSLLFVVFFCIVAAPRYVARISKSIGSRERRELSSMPPCLDIKQNSTVEAGGENAWPLFAIEAGTRKPASDFSTARPLPAVITTAHGADSQRSQRSGTRCSRTSARTDSQRQRSRFCSTHGRFDDGQSNDRRYAHSRHLRRNRRAAANASELVDAWRDDRFRRQAA